jgi:two-component system nitrogen regulation response regulator GlnG
LEHLSKPVDLRQLRSVVARALEISRLQHVPAIFDDAANAEEDEIPSDRIVGRSRPMQEVYKMVGRVAAEDVTVLILGSSGTGKELVARALYHYSHRADKPFLAINCAALPETLLESELFGHERGAFTGANAQRIGIFEKADGGTLFLDEVGDMSPATQAKVLRVLQDGRFERIGGSETIETDVRVLAATNQDLDARIERGEFRHDLLYRLNGFTIRLPSLRERLEDIPDLVQHFLKATKQQLNKPTASIAPNTMELLCRYEWPGNVRELQSVIKHAVVHAVGDMITPDCLPLELRSFEVGSRRSSLQPKLTCVAHFVRTLLEANEPNVYRRVLAEVDKTVLQETLRFVEGNQVQASERLGMSRTTLRNKLQSLRLPEHDSFQDDASASGG